MSRTQLTPELFFDLIDRRLTAIDICSRHELSFDQLEAIVQSQAFQANIARLQSVEHTRSTATDTLRRTAALRTLEDIAAQQPTSPTHTETIRLAAAQILRVTNADPHAPHDPSDEPDPTDPSRTPQHQHHPHTDPHQSGNDSVPPYPTPNQDTPRLNTHTQPNTTTQDQPQHPFACNPPQTIQPGSQPSRKLGTMPNPHANALPAPTQEPRTQPIHSSAPDPTPTQPASPSTSPSTGQAKAQTKAQTTTPTTAPSVPAAPNRADNSNPPAQSLVACAGSTQPIPGKTHADTQFSLAIHQRSPPPQHAA
ncbi:MAG: hypothetical protein ACF8MF_01235 [Phycisphaerales bacterium JB052]